MSLQDQIAIQVRLGIISGELVAGDKLPSVRELARRFRLHANTVSLAYARLAREGWLERRRGSGMYVRPQSAPHRDGAKPEQGDAILASLLKEAALTARALGLSEAALQLRLSRAFAQPTVGRLLLVEPDPSLRHRARGAERRCGAAD